MNELVRFSARRTIDAPALFGPFPEGGASSHEIEGSWSRVEPPRQIALLPSVARAARTALLAWGGISLAAVSGAAVVYAHGGFGGEVTAIEEAEAPPQQAVVTVAPQQAAAAVAPQQAAATVAPQQPVAAAARKSVRIIETARAPVGDLVALAALPTPAVPTHSPPAVTAPPAVTEIPTAQAEPLEARLPKPRPEPPLVTASIPTPPSKPAAKPSAAPPRAANVRRPVYAGPVYVGGYPVHRPRYYYRYRAPVF